MNKLLLTLTLLAAASLSHAGLQVPPSTDTHTPQTMLAGSRITTDYNGGYRIHRDDGSNTHCRTDYNGGYRCN